jgi:hypothetical protein
VSKNNYYKEVFMGGKSNPISDVLHTVTKAIDDTFSEIDRVASGGGIHLDPFVKQKQEAKDEAKKAKKEQDAARRKAEEDKKAAIRLKARNAEAAKGGTILLGNNKNKAGGSSVSSGMGLSKGKTGLQT